MQRIVASWKSRGQKKYGSFWDFICRFLNTGIKLHTRLQRYFNTVKMYYVCFIHHESWFSWKTFKGSYIDAHAIQMNIFYILFFPGNNCSKPRELKLLDVTSSVRHDMNVSLFISSSRFIFHLWKLHGGSLNGRHLGSSNLKQYTAWMSLSWNNYVSLQIIALQILKQNFPQREIHRKHWCFEQMITGLRQLCTRLGGSGRSMLHVPDQVLIGQMF